MSDEIYVPIVKIYTAARQGIPDQAEGLSLISGRLTSIVTTLDIETAKAGDPPALRDALTIAGRIHDGIRRGITTLNHAAFALEATGDDYVEHDAQARDEFNKWNSALKGLEPTRTTVPADIGSPESPGAVLVDPTGHSYPHVIYSSDYDPETPGEDESDRDDTAQEDKDDLGLPYDPTAQWR